MRRRDNEQQASAAKMGGISRRLSRVLTGTRACQLLFLTASKSCDRRKSLTGWLMVHGWVIWVDEADPVTVGIPRLDRPKELLKQCLAIPVQYT
ncbi:uncharacterized protein BO66DRAFT_74283 [Aspergillus aculeatinus CBS 121060]|uniref:Uncharacterized protein n=1 Tax=Aspergillus aculeatinus CBS 121060 TaxID=1448322 RepID=A0ACD1HBZ1_9EURO|nr:hypothetical protein BO66DRAFT_74283 [Aspergillus aculeatinus CBS 121060]RAH70900.1 hypothetical protein BO66DRAFT_74283 [Aspergillus aculeatinus CBS 121060]